MRASIWPPLSSSSTPCRAAPAARPADASVDREEEKRRIKLNEKSRREVEERS